MNQFTFGILTYNHRDYIIEHLESIKYQILNYGDLHKINLILADDFSNDDTVQISKKWLECNKKIFYNYKILTTECNLGIVKNFSRLLKEIQTEQFKILAGDDIYYKNNIFQLLSEPDVVLTCPVKFSHLGVIDDDPMLTYKRMLVENNVKNFVAKRLKYNNCIGAPGVFYKQSLLDEELFRTMNRFSWIEDVPMWVYFFNKDNIKVKVVSDIFVLYRMGVGISNNVNHKKRLGFEQDLDKIRHSIFIKDRFPYNRLLVWDKSLFKKLLKYYYCNTPEIQRFEANVAKVKNEGADYLKFIHGKAESFLKDFEIYS